MRGINIRCQEVEVDDIVLLDHFQPEERLVTSFNEYYRIGLKDELHDANGNWIMGYSKYLSDKYQIDVTIYPMWDAFNRMRGIFDLDPDENTNVDFTYIYDAFGRRVGKLDGNLLQSEVYAFDGWREIAVSDFFTGALEREWVYGAFIDEPICMDVNTGGGATCNGSGDTRYYYHQSDIYSVLGLTNAGGNLVEAYEYDPYGRHVVISNSGADATWFTADDTRTPMGESALGNPWTFTGRRFDAESGLMYYRMRYYDVDRDNDTPNHYKNCINCGATYKKRIDYLWQPDKAGDHVY